MAEEEARKKEGSKVGRMRGMVVCDRMWLLLEVFLSSVCAFDVFTRSACCFLSVAKARLHSGDARMPYRVLFRGGFRLQLSYDMLSRSVLVSFRHSQSGGFDPPVQPSSPKLNSTSASTLQQFNNNYHSLAGDLAPL